MSTLPAAGAMEVFATNVKARMEAKGVSMSALATATGMSRPGLSAMLHLRGGNCTLETAEKIAIALDTQLHSLLKS